MPISNDHLIAATRALLDHIADRDLPFPEEIDRPGSPMNPCSDRLLIIVKGQDANRWLATLVVDTVVDSDPNFGHGTTRYRIDCRLPDLGVRVTVYTISRDPLTYAVKQVA